MDEQPQDPSPKPCPECGGQRIEASTTPSVALIQPLQSARAFFTGKSNIFSMKVFVCTRCGYTIFYATIAIQKEAAAWIGVPRR